MFLDRLLCKLFGHKSWAVDRDDCSRCGEELPGLGPAAGTTVVSAMLPGELWKRPEPPRYKAQPMIPWWGKGPPPGWVEPEPRVWRWFYEEGVSATGTVGGRWVREEPLP